MLDDRRQTHSTAESRRSSPVAFAPPGPSTCQSGVIAVEHPLYLEQPGHPADSYKSSADSLSAQRSSTASPSHEDEHRGSHRPQRRGPRGGRPSRACWSVLRMFDPFVMAERGNVADGTCTSCICMPHGSCNSLPATPAKAA
jgi:hypothetical protein